MSRGVCNSGAGIHPLLPNGVCARITARCRVSTCRIWVHTDGASVWCLLPSLRGRIWKDFLAVWLCQKAMLHAGSGGTRGINPVNWGPRRLQSGDVTEGHKVHLHGIQVDCKTRANTARLTRWSVACRILHPKLSAQCLCAPARVLSEKRRASEAQNVVRLGSSDNRTAA